MPRYVVLLRGINVGGKNKLPMAELKQALIEHGCTEVATYIQSGNVVLTSTERAKTLAESIEQMLIKRFEFDSALIRVLVLTRAQFTSIVEDRPEGFGGQPDRYHSDVIFLMGVTATEAMRVFNPREGVDAVWPGKGVVYSQRLSAERTKSRLSTIVGTPVYASMTIRNWNTTTKLLELLRA
ncbi:MAG: DUF1697 domain-containing protein [Chloroflexi bacterium]|nr:MAG: DUF1697 domain-containing protein [Chloroflexota bacterium]